MNNLQHMYLHHSLLHNKQVAPKVELIKALPEWLPPKMGLLRIEDPESKTLSFVVLVMFPSCLTYLQIFNTLHEPFQDQIVHRCNFALRNGSVPKQTSYCLARFKVFLITCIVLF